MPAFPSRSSEGRGPAPNGRPWIPALAGILLCVSPAPAQERAPTPYDRALAAGYKALTLCSGIFNAGRTQAQVEAIELSGTQFNTLIPTLSATVERGGDYNAMVTVPFDQAMPPRAAYWTHDRGCTIAPIGTTPKIHPLSFFVAPKPRTVDGLAWPLGEQGARGRVSGNSKALNTATNAALLSSSYGERARTTGVVVVQSGRIVDEQYHEGFGPHVSQRTWSVAKSLTGTLMGVAAQKKLVSVQQKTGIPEWQTDSDPRGEIVLDQLLRMASGLHSETAGNRTDALYFGGTSVTQEVTAWPLDAMPGTRFRYANNDIVLAMRALRAKLGDEAYASFPQQALFDKIGMTRTVAETDWQGNFILSSQVWSTARDLARFGLLYLNDGVWNGERILPEGWVKYVTTPSGPQPEGDFGYGATFWLMNKSPGVPADTYAAFGNRGQYVVIVPSRKVVIVRRGEDPTGARFDIAKFTADVLASLK